MTNAHCPNAYGSYSGIQSLASEIYIERESGEVIFGNVTRCLQCILDVIKKNYVFFYLQVGMFSPAICP